MLRFSTLTSTLFRGHSVPPNKCPLLPPSYVCNSAVIACIMAMVGKGVCGRASNPTAVYREPGERIRSTCPGVQHPETMRVGWYGLRGGAQVNKGQIVVAAESSATLQSLPTSEAPLPMPHHSVTTATALRRVTPETCSWWAGGSCYCCTHFPCFRGGSGPHVTLRHSLHTCV